MKIPLLLVTCLFLAGCCREEPKVTNQALLSELQTIKSELAKAPPAPTKLRWATADHYKIFSALTQASRDHLARTAQTDQLSPAIEAQIREYESLRMQLVVAQANASTRSIPVRPIRISTGSTGLPERESNPDPELQALSKRVEEAKAPIKELIEKRDRLAQEFREKHSVERLTEEYAKGRYDLIVGTREKPMYQAGTEVTDITEAVIALLKEKTK
ncbi:MAG TPA: hypothetical protein VGH19_13030 [Verrucomicrobiae bacterium]